MVTGPGDQLIDSILQKDGLLCIMHLHFILIETLSPMPWQLRMFCMLQD